MSTPRAVRLSRVVVLWLVVHTFPVRASDVTIRLYDYSSSERKLVRQASDVASELFARAGLQTHWEQCRTHAWSTNRDASCLQSANASVLQLRLHDEQQSKRIRFNPRQFGYALPSDEGFGVIAGVFVHEIENLARSQGLDLASLLGHVMAHELGHLLLGSNQHGRQGIMRPQWRDRDLRFAQIGLLEFTPEQGVRMRAQTAARAMDSHEQGPVLRAGAAGGASGR